jgi:hypothetical protein
MEMEKQFVDFVRHLFTLEWALWALPISLVLSFLSNRVVVSLVLAVVAVAVHHVGLVALPALLSGGDMSALPDQIQTVAKGLEPISVGAEFVAYAFLIIIFSLTRRDMFRPGVTH